MKDRNPDELENNWKQDELKETLKIERTRERSEIGLTGKKGWKSNELENGRKPDELNERLDTGRTGRKVGNRTNSTRSEIELRWLKRATRSEIQLRGLERATRIIYTLVVAVKVYVNWIDGLCQLD